MNNEIMVKEKINNEFNCDIEVTIQNNIVVINGTSKTNISQTFLNKVVKENLGKNYLVFNFINKMKKEKITKDIKKISFKELYNM